MGTFTARGISCSPILLTLTPETTLEDLAGTMSESRYMGQSVPGEGWGSVYDDNERLQVRGTRPAGGAPGLGDTGLLQGRYYKDVLDKRVLKAVGQVEDEKLYQLNGWDVLVESPHAGAATAWVSTKQDEGLRYVKPALLALGSSAISGSTHGALPEDFFLWLIYRFLNNQQLSDVLRLELVRSVAATDHLRRRSRIIDTASMDRVDLVALVAARRHSFGPIKMAIRDDDLGLLLDFELEASLAFTVHVTNSQYDEAQGDDRLRMTRDVIQLVVPRLRQAYANDDTWTGTTRAQWLNQCHDAIAAQFPARPPDGT